mmetsp:Transcript_24076/g.66993  ORF Transcript_24076/g.66993 Transcript_24076/m.66993 type:complete len:379 (-) Transcript_24076:238-1374(-)
MSILDELIEERHLRVERNTDLVARRQLECAPVIGCAQNRLQVFFLNHVVDLVANALHRFPRLVRIHALRRKLREEIIDVKFALHELKNVALRHNATFLRGTQPAPPFVVDLSLDEDFLVRLPIVLAIPAEPHEPCPFFPVNSLLVASGVGTVEIYGAQELGLLESARICADCGLHVDALVIKIQKREGFQKPLLVDRRSTEEQVGQMLNNPRLQKRHFVRPHPILGSVPDEALGGLPRSVLALLRLLCRAPPRPTKPKQNEDVVEAHVAEGLALQSRHEKGATADAQALVELLRNLCETQVIEPHVRVQVHHLLAKPLNAPAHEIDLFGRTPKAFAFLAKSSKAKEKIFVLHASELIHLREFRPQHFLECADWLLVHY